LGGRDGALPCHQEGLFGSFWQQPTAQLVLARHKAAFRQPQVPGAASLVVGLEAALGQWSPRQSGHWGPLSVICKLAHVHRVACVSRDKGSKSSVSWALPSRTNWAGTGSVELQQQMGSLACGA